MFLRTDGSVYAVYLPNGGGGMLDMSAAGVSLAALYRTEFGSVVASRGLDALLEALRKRTGRRNVISEIAPAAGPRIAERRRGFDSGIMN